MNVAWELEDLEKTFKRYGFETERWLIPQKNAHLRLMSKALEIVMDHQRDDKENDLVIIYYANHASALWLSARQAFLRMKCWSDHNQSPLVEPSKYPYK